MKKSKLQDLHKGYYEKSSARQVKFDKHFARPINVVCTSLLLLLTVFTLNIMQQASPNNVAHLFISFNF